MVWWSVYGVGAVITFIICCITSFREVKKRLETATTPWELGWVSWKKVLFNAIFWPVFWLYILSTGIFGE